MCEDRTCICKGHRHHRIHHHGHWKYSTIAKRTSESESIPQILFEVNDIEEGDFYKIYIKKIKKKRS